MRVYNNFDEIDIIKGTVLTVGTYDGLHLGHQHILSKLTKTATSAQLADLLITIHPHPQIVLQKENKPEVKLLTTLNERLILFEKFGVSNVLVIPFTKDFANTNPEIFVKDYLIEKCKMKKMIIGYDHLFGKDRQGNYDLLANMQKEYSFEITKIEPFLLDGEPISSTKIRNAISSTNIETANKMLGYNYLIQGTVVKGQGRARSLGWPTANFNMFDKNKLIPANGVYFVASYINGEKVYGMANIGYRPTLTNDTTLTLEVNYFDIEMDLYGKILEVEFIKYLRPEIKFPSINELLEKIKEDEAICRELANSEQQTANS